MASAPLMRMQVPAFQVRVSAIALAAVALVPIELLWPLTGFCMLLIALLLAELADRLDAMALRPPPAGVLAFATPVLALIGIVLAGRSPLAVDLALLLAIILVADRQGRSGEARPWMIFTPASALLLMVATGLFGVLAQGLRVAMLLAIASIGAIILRRRA